MYETKEIHGYRSDQRNKFAQKERNNKPLSVASAKEAEMMSSFSMGYSQFGFGFKPFSENPYTIKSSRNPYNPSMDRIDFKNKGTLMKYRKKVFGSVDSNGNLKQDHELNFPHFVRIDRVTAYADQQKEFYKNVEFWKTVVGPFSYRISKSRPNKIKRFQK